MIDEKEYEVRYYFKGELACPKPTEYCKYTKTYEQMKFEYDLKDVGKITIKDILKALLKLKE